MTTAAEGAGRRDNGLTAAAYVPLVDVDPEVADVLLTALRRARIAAYLEAPAGGDSAPADRPRLYVAEDDRGDARTIVAAAARHARTGGSAGAPSVDDDDDAVAAAAPVEPVDLTKSEGPQPPDDTDQTFREMVANWHVDTVAAVRAAERDLSREDADWRGRLTPPEEAADEEEHYVPPPPPPLPRLALQTIWALIILIASVAMLAFGDMLGLGGNLAFFLGVGGILVGTGMLLMRLREGPAEDDGDDGAVL
jgi:hypothetical protein